jgi:peptidoglycan biosynthesis protein MviN/MurJ (putative lipid II flippase)
MLARGRIAGRLSLWAITAAILWAGELGLQLLDLSGRPSLGAARLFFAAGAAFCLSAAVPWMLDRTQSRGRLEVWSLTRRLFALQLALCALVPVVAVLQGRPWTADPRSVLAEMTVILALAWVVFAGPWIAMWIALRRTSRWSDRPQTLEDVLRGPSGR